jgi:hypothetical protein
VAQPQDAVDLGANTHEWVQGAPGILKKQRDPMPESFA